MKCHLSLPLCQLVQNANSKVPILWISVWMYTQASRRSKQEQLKMTHLNFAILIIHVVTVVHLKFIKSTYFQDG